MELVKENGLGLATALRKAMPRRGPCISPPITRSIIRGPATRATAWAAPGPGESGRQRRRAAAKATRTTRARTRGRARRPRGAGKVKKKGGFTIVGQAPDRQMICYGYNDEGKVCDGQ